MFEELRLCQWLLHLHSGNDLWLVCGKSKAGSGILVFLLRMAQVTGDRQKRQTSNGGTCSKNFDCASGCCIFTQEITFGSCVTRARRGQICGQMPSSSVKMCLDCPTLCCCHQGCCPSTTCTSMAATARNDRLDFVPVDSGPRQKSLSGIRACDECASQCCCESLDGVSYCCETHNCVSPTMPLAAATPRDCKGCQQSPEPDPCYPFCRPPMFGGCPPHGPCPVTQQFSPPNNGVLCKSCSSNCCCNEECCDSRNCDFRRSVKSRHFPSREVSRSEEVREISETQKYSENPKQYPGIHGIITLDPRNPSKTTFLVIPDGGAVQLVPVQFIASVKIQPSPEDPPFQMPPPLRNYRPRKYKPEKILEKLEVLPTVAYSNVRIEEKPIQTESSKPVEHQHPRTHIIRPTARSYAESNRRRAIPDSHNQAKDEKLSNNSFKKIPDGTGHHTGLLGNLFSTLGIRKLDDSPVERQGLQPADVSHRKIYKNLQNAERANGALKEYVARLRGMIVSI